ncbi:MAG: flagellar M-ring protein FliF [Alphaproteobacteria bacterium]|nr:flagellar M-ring protein FliF [Alphaproteobacteria bacterium]MBT4020263.1 flagellar M-ring protein FliF [Alphaproteobacteria bacterium]MBT5918790.1 flagellar M-ring protein FliF [Alphaproteobacteria bacterium]
MNPLFNLIQSLGPARVIAMAGVAAGLIGFFIFLTARVTAPQMSLLYSDLDTTDSSQIVAQLESQQIPFEIRANGTQILVPDQQVARVRLQMAGEGLPSGGSIGYEIFDRGDTLGTTSFVQNINKVRALEGELARTIKSLDRVSGARVHLVLPERELFTRERRQPTASIVLKLKGGSRLESGQVASIQHLVAAAIPDLSTSRVSIIDDRGNLLARGDGDEDGGASAVSSIDEFRSKYESKIKSAVEKLLSRSVGNGKVRAEVAADLDYDRITTNSETYDPDGQVVRSTQTVSENASSTDSEGNAPVTVAGSLPENRGGQGDQGNTTSTSNDRSEETVNFEISKSNTVKVTESGVLKRLSVAILVDGVYEGEGQNKTYKPRPPEEIEQLATLARSAVGYNEGRGDVLEVVNLRFAPLNILDIPDEEAAFLGLGKDDYFRVAEIIIFAIVGLLVVLLVLRPLVSRALSIAQAQAEAVAAARTAQIEAERAQQAALSAPKGPDGQPLAVTDGSEEGEDVDSMINMAQVEGRVRASSVKKIGDIVDKHPEEALAIMRTWMYQE